MSYPMRETDAIGQSGEAQIHILLYSLYWIPAPVYSDVPCILTQRQADLRHPPHAHAAISTPQTWYMLDLVVVGIVRTDQRWLRVTA